MHWLTFLLMLFIAHGLILSFFVVLEKRKPASTLAWILALLFIPFLGAFFYYLFGRMRFLQRRKLRTTTLTHFDQMRSLLAPERDKIETELPPFLQQKFKENYSELSNLPAHPSVLCDSLQKITRQTIQASVGLHNEICLFHEGIIAFGALQKAIEVAEDHIHLLYYIFRNDQIGTQIRDLLVQKALEGVEVRVLVDGIGSIELPSDFFEPLLRAGGEFAIFHPLRLKFKLRRSQINFRNHRKIVVVDGCIGFTGGLNVGDEYLSRDPKIGHWRDTHIQMKGSAVHQLQQIFLEDWFYSSGQTLPSSRYYPLLKHEGQEDVQVIPSGPDFPAFSIRHVFFVAITMAQKRVWITTPYFIPDEPIRIALETASLRGVDVRLLLPHKSDQKVVMFAARSYYQTLLEAGVRIYEYKKGMLHSKTMVVDSIFSSIGSANMDMRSFQLNFETNVSLYSSNLAEEMESVFREDCQEASIVSSIGHQNRPFREKFAEAISRLFSPLL